MLVELLVSGQPPLNPWHLPLVVLWGLAYVTFANLYATFGPGACSGVQRAACCVHAGVLFLWSRAHVSAA